MIGNTFIFLEDEKLSDHQKQLAFLFEMGQEEQCYTIIQVDNNEKVQVWKINIKVDSGENPIGKHCGFWNGHLMITSNQALFYIDISEHMKKTTARLVGQQIATELNQDQGFATIELKSSEFKKLRMKPGWKIHHIKEIMPVGECTLVCENTSTSIITFFQVKDLTDGPATLLPLSSAMERSNELEQDDPIVKYESLMCHQEDINEHKQCGIALRKSGSIDFYYNFRLIET